MRLAPRGAGMDILLLMLLFAGAVLAGLLGSMLGIGGGIIIVPLLTLGFGVPLTEASGASIIAVIVTSSAGATHYVEQKIVNLRLGMLLEVSTVAGAIIGALSALILVAIPLGEPVLKILLAVVLIYAAYYLTFRRVEVATQSVPPTTQKRGLLQDIAGTYRDATSGREVGYLAKKIAPGSVAALGAGVLSGLFGIGGGIIKVPAMILWMGVPTRVATATSNFMIGVTGTAGAAIYYTNGKVIPSIVAPIVIGVFVGALAGSRISSHVNSIWLRRIFAVVLIVTAIETIARALGVSPL